MCVCIDVGREVGCLIFPLGLNKWTILSTCSIGCRSLKSDNRGRTIWGMAVSVCLSVCIMCMCVICERM